LSKPTRKNSAFDPLQVTTCLFTVFADSKSPIRAENVELIDDNPCDGSMEEIDVLRGEGYNVRIIVRIIK
jgi:hypothetical protein